MYLIYSQKALVADVEASKHVEFAPLTKVKPIKAGHLKYTGGHPPQHECVKKNKIQPAHLSARKSKTAHVKFLF